MRIRTVVTLKVHLHQVVKEGVYGQLKREIFVNLQYKLQVINYMSAGHTVILFCLYVSMIWGHAEIIQIHDAQ